ncbi:MAG TPA: hypothetical protein VEL47_03355 [Myxococcota bacterium]|nr:hypothetical protein [Myxococcota bacterium]
MSKQKLYCLSLCSLLALANACGEDIAWNKQAEQDAERGSSLYRDILKCIDTKETPFNRSVNRELTNPKAFFGHCTGKDMTALIQEYECVLKTCNEIQSFTWANVKSCRQAVTKSCSAIGANFS